MGTIEDLKELKIEMSTSIKSFGDTSITIDGNHCEWFGKDNLQLILKYLIEKNVIFSFRYNMDDYDFTIESDYQYDSRDFEWEITIFWVDVY